MRRDNLEQPLMHFYGGANDHPRALRARTRLEWGQSFAGEGCYHTPDFVREKRHGRAINPGGLCQDRAGETPIQYPHMIRDQDCGRVIRGEMDDLEVLP
jgi:hypothetical protein